MTEERDNLLPETNESSPRMYYSDLKHPLLQRGIPVPQAMEDYIDRLSVRDTLRRDEIETIRQEMLEIFKVSEQEVPVDFNANFETWFPTT